MLPRQSKSGAPGWAGSSAATGEGVVSLSPPPQQPTRSLWVGNLDPKTSPAELQEVFAPYGAIESLRLIPEKVGRTHRHGRAVALRALALRRTAKLMTHSLQECGFVNFVSVADATRAKEDVLNRLGGQLTKTSGLVRIGYGKGR